MRIAPLLASVVVSSSAAAQGFGPDLFAPYELLDGGVGLNSIHAVDMNADGRPDLQTTDYQNSGAIIFLQQPDGTFGAGQVYSFFGFPPAPLPDPRPADLDADGLPDVVSPAFSSVRARLGTGGGQLGPLLASVAPYKMFGEGFQVADFTGDGLADALAAAPSYQDSSQIFGAKGLGDGTFGGFGLLLDTRRPKESVVGDFDLDGDLDALFLVEDHSAPAPPPGLLLLQNPGNGLLQQAPWTQNVTYQARFSKPADLDADGSLDLFLFDTYTKKVQALLGTDDATFELQDVTTLFTVPEDVAAADLDADGYPDLVASAQLIAAGMQAQRLVRLVPAGPVELYDDFSFGEAHERLTAADLDGDALPDVVTMALRTLVVLHDALGPFIAIDAGSPGGPLLTLSGQPSPGQAVTLSLAPSGAPTPGLLVIGLSPANQPTAAGLLVPEVLQAIPLSLPASSVSTWPAGLPAGTLVYVQGVALGDPSQVGNAVVVVPES